MKFRLWRCFLNSSKFMLTISLVSLLVQTVFVYTCLLQFCLWEKTLHTFVTWPENGDGKKCLVSCFKQAEKTNLVNLDIHERWVPESNLGLKTTFAGNTCLR